MKIIVYKGFNLNFIKNQSVEPLIKNEYEIKFNYRLLDDNYKNQMTMMILTHIDSDKEFFITYEEFELAYDFIMLFANQNKLSI